MTDAEEGQRKDPEQRARLEGHAVMGRRVQPGLQLFGVFQRGVPELCQRARGRRPLRPRQPRRRHVALRAARARELGLALTLTLKPKPMSLCARHAPVSSRAGGELAPGARVGVTPTARQTAPLQLGGRSAGGQQGGGDGVLHSCILSLCILSVHPLSVHPLYASSLRAGGSHHCDSWTQVTLTSAEGREPARPA